MRPHPRIRKTIKWGGLVLSVVLATLAFWTTGRVWRYQHVRGLRVHSYYFGHGAARYYRQSATGRGFLPSHYTGWSTWALPKRGMMWWFDNAGSDPIRIIVVPFWVPAAACLIASALAWRLDTLATRRAKLGMCPKCSYSRTGLAASAPCPECGSAAPSA